MTTMVLENARVFDGFNAECSEGMSVAIENGRIREVSQRPIALCAAHRIDVAGKTLMPGMIDLHMHAYMAGTRVEQIDSIGQASRTAHAVRVLGHALDCGFTTIRDIGGGDWSLWQALEGGLIRGPRFFYAGRPLSMTGGHADVRPPSVDGHVHGPGRCSCSQFSTLTAVVDGVDQCVWAAREELRRGAHTVKIMGSGGALSLTGPLGMSQFRDDEIRAIVGECVERGSYVSAHCHPTKAIRRCVDLGVRCIEHGSMIDEDTAAFVAEKGAYIVPTLAIGFAFRDLGRELGLSAEVLAKGEPLWKEGLYALERMRKARIKLGFGTDLIGDMYTRQCTEFSLRSEVFSPLEILRQATSMGAEILQQQGQLGCIAVGAHADLIVVDGDPLADIGLMAQNGRNLALILRAGELIKNQLDC